MPLSLSPTPAIARPRSPGTFAFLRDGRRVLCRRAGPDDADALVELYAALSDRSRYTRFCSATPRLTGQLRRGIADIERGPVWMALVRGRCVGEARLVRSAHSGDAHAAVAIADDCQHLGLGSQLSRLLLADPEAGLQPIVVTILPDNTAAVGLASRYGFALRLDDGVLEGRIPARVGLAAMGVSAA